MKALVLAAGVGERMRPLTDQLPKPLLPIANRPVMGCILEHLGRHGFTEVLANVHYRAAEIEQALGDGAEYGVHLTYSYEDKLWGSAGSVKRNQGFFGDDPFLVIGADDLTDMDLSLLVSRHEQAGATASLGLVEVEETSQYGIVVTDEAGRLQRFVEKPKGAAPSNTANAQVYLLAPRIHEFIPPGVWYDFGYNVFPALIAAGEPCYGFTLPGYWRDIGSAADYLGAQRDLMEGRVNLTIPGEQIQPGIWVGAGSEIEATAQLTAPVVIGDHCRIGAEAKIGEGTAIASGVGVPARTSLRNCVLWAGAQVPAGAELRRCVIGREGVIVGPV